MFRHFVPSRWLHPLATLVRLSLVDLPSANSMKCCSPPASLEKQIPKIRPFGQKNPPKAVWVFTLSALGGSYHIWRVCLFCCGIRRKRVEGTEVVIGDLRGAFFSQRQPSAPLGIETIAEPNRIRMFPVSAIFSSRFLGSADGVEVRSRERRRIHRRPS